MHYLYRITNNLDGKIYIGQSNNPEYRWKQHKYDSQRTDPIQYIHRAIAKHGIENFVFEVIAGCKTQEDTDETESLLIKQYDSRNKEHGYNLMIGGSHGGHSEETKQKQSKATLQQIATQGHPAQGNKWTDEQRTKLSETLKSLDKEAIYTEEVRQRMSEAHLGIKDTEETKQRKSESAAQAWKERVDYSEIKCQAEGCDVAGKAKYKIIDGIRYCNKHGLRMLRYGRLNTLSD
jgi:group I intron endonuclease